MKWKALVAVVAALAMLVVVPTEAAADWNGNRKVVAAATSCTLHYKVTNIAGSWDSAHAYTYRSDSGWYRSIWNWNSCNGGFYAKIIFDVDCKLKYWEALIAPDGSTRYWVLLGSRGNGCNARPGTLRFVTDGSLRTYSGYPTLLSTLGGGQGSPFQYEFFQSTDSSGNPYVQERVMGWCSPCGDYIGVSYAPLKYLQ